MSLLKRLMVKFPNCWKTLKSLLVASETTTLHSKLKVQLSLRLRNPTLFWLKRAWNASTKITIAGPLYISVRLRPQRKAVDGSVAHQEPIRHTLEMTNFTASWLMSAPKFLPIKRRNKTDWTLKLDKHTLKITEDGLWQRWDMRRNKSRLFSICLRNLTQRPLNWIQRIEPSINGTRPKQDQKVIFTSLCNCSQHFLIQLKKMLLTSRD